MDCYYFRMYRLWVCLLANKYLPVEAAGRSPRVLATWKGPNKGWYRTRSNLDIGLRTTESKAVGVVRLQDQNTVPVRFFDPKSSVKSSQNSLQKIPGISQYLRKKIRDHPKRVMSRAEDFRVQPALSEGKSILFPLQGFYPYKSPIAKV